MRHCGTGAGEICGPSSGTWTRRARPPTCSASNPKIKGGGKALVAGRRPLDDAIKGTDFDHLDLIPADFSYRHLDFDLDSTKRPTDRIRRMINPLKGEYDVVVLDCPPSVSLVSENIVHACDVLLVPLIPAMLSVRTYDQLIDFVDGMP